MKKAGQWVKETNSTLRRSLSTTTSAGAANLRLRFRNSGASSSTSVSGHRPHGTAVYTGGYGANKSWVHAPDALQYGHVEYGVKFFGECQVSQAKGQQVIKDAIHKLRFRLDENRFTQGSQVTKLMKTLLQISVDSVTVVDAKTLAVMYKYPLHRISFCADDKEDKRVFSFIAKRPNSEEHDCFVFLSDKMAEEITLTIGQAFDLAYRKFLERDGRDLEYQKQIYSLRQKMQQLQEENTRLKQQLGLDTQMRDNPAKAWSTMKQIEGAPSTLGGVAVPPQLPTSPIPAKPPAKVAPANIKPPPPPPKPVRKRSEPIATSGLSIVPSDVIDSASLNDLNSTSSPSSATKPDEIFDDDFDPRRKSKTPEATEKAGAMELPLNGTAVGQASTSRGPPPGVQLRSPDPFDDDFFHRPLQPNAVVRDSIAIPDNVDDDFDKHLNDMRRAFEGGMGIGDTGTIGKDMLNQFDPLANNNGS